MESKFQVDLRGIIDILSSHLYSTPDVFIRELLQNAIDALTAREAVGGDFARQVRVEVIEGSSREQGSLVVEDEGIGLEESEIHQFLATIGMSSKRQRDELESQRREYLGQFGIGLLSCFLVSDEITVVTRSAKRADSPALQWRGKSDGTYELTTLKGNFAPGTQVYLKPRPGNWQRFSTDSIRQLLVRYGKYLPVPIVLVNNGQESVVNESVPPWGLLVPANAPAPHALKETSDDFFNDSFLDRIPLRSESGGVKGIAYVLSQPAKPNSVPSCSVFLRGMLLSDKVENLLPDWAFFVKAIVNTNRLRPTASREELVNDEVLEKTRQELGRCLQDYLSSLSSNHPERFARLLGVHHVSFKAMAIHDDDFLRLIADQLPFETNYGTMTLGEYRQKFRTIRYVPTRDQFRQIARVATAQETGIINAGYVFETELVERLPQAFPAQAIERVDPNTFVEEMTPLGIEERRAAHEFLRKAQSTLNGYECAAELKRFAPADLPALYTIDHEGLFLRSIERTREVSGPLFASVLSNFKGGQSPKHHRFLTFNAANPLVQRLIEEAESDLTPLAIEILYVQTLLLGHHPLGAREIVVLNNGMMELLERAMGNRAGEEER